MKCSTCGSELADGTLFCSRCGASQNNSPYTQKQPNSRKQPQASKPPRQPMSKKQQQAPKSPRQPMSKKQNGILIGIAATAVVLILIFAVIIPLISRGPLSGSYVSDSEYVVTFYDGTFAVYDTDDHAYSDVGTYTVKDNTVYLVTAEGYESELALDGNELIYNGTVYKQKDKHARTPIQLTENYEEELEQKLLPIIKDILTDEEVCNEAVNYGSYFVYQDDLAEPYTKFEEALSKKLNYSKDEVLQFMLEEYNMAIDIEISEDGKPTIYVY